MATKILLSNSRHKISYQNGKITFPRKFFRKTWLIIEDCKYNYTAETKIVKSYLVALSWEKTNLEKCA